MTEIYADHAATTFPRPPEVADAISSYLLQIGCNPGRGGYRRSLEAARLVYEARMSLAALFNVPRPEQVVFTPSVTYALNLLLKGVLHSGEHVLLSSMEHNAVVRPLARLAGERGVIVEVLACRQDGSLDPLQVKRALRGNTRLVVLTHASNVTGTILPVCEVGELLAGSGVLYAIDAAQTAGGERLDFGELSCDYLAFTGHKGLLGPPGIGGLVLSERAAELTRPLVEGGTGSRSEEEEQPSFLPDKFESGTQNIPGIAGLAAGVRLAAAAGDRNIARHKQELTAVFLEGLAALPGVTVYGTKRPEKMTAVVSVNIEGFDSGDLSFILEQGFGIMTRSGLHCAPLAHRTIGTFPQGTLRFSFGYGNTTADVLHILNALKDIIKEKH
ncbi:MAG: aminotransferase class V-fold PLP-dependent enzyme [Firmicutes bacterium]|nr:aminotransferase class V-fold PLP-dependent enzyme [Bacillota bacterium]